MFAALGKMEKMVKKTSAKWIFYAESVGALNGKMEWRCSHCDYRYDEDLHDDRDPFKAGYRYCPECGSLMAELDIDLSSDL